MQFPHLGDTRFPNLQNVNVYEFQNNFDYTRWSEETVIKLCNVIWNSDYTDVVKFDTDEARDSWFDSLTDVHAVRLLTAARLVPEGYVKLPIPYDVMAKYNYLFIDMPIATSNTNKIDYETDDGVRRWYFFIENIVYLSPNTTQVFLSPDIWTIYQNEIDFNYMLLERGHAPVAYTDTDTYLANPIENNMLLLAPDVTFDNAGVNKSVTHVPFGNGIKFVCIASTCAPEDILNLGYVTQDANYDPTSPPFTYNDLSPRYGYQLEVEDFTIGNGYNYSYARTPAAAAHSDDNRIPNNLSVYALPADSCYGNGTFFQDVLRECPQFLNTVQGCFVVDQGCLILGSMHTIAGHTVYRCIGRSQTLLTKALTKADFDYPSRYERFAKLYTSPYAQLEITDNDSITHTINIEETSTLSVKSVVALAFPFINERVYIDGIGGTGSLQYSWIDLAGNPLNVEISKSDWFKYCFDWKIPTFGLFMDGETAYQLNSFNRTVKQGINNALVAYHNTMRSANTAYENACDAADAAWANTVDSADCNKINADRSADTAKDNAYLSADTGKTNSYASADTAKTNADNSADTAKTNANNIAATEKDNADDSATIAKSIADRNALTSQTVTTNNANVGYDVVDRTATCQTNNQTLSNALRTNILNAETAMATTQMRQGQQKALTAVTYANALCIQTTDANKERSTAIANNNNINSVLTGAISGASQAAVLGATIAGSAGTAIAPGLGTFLGLGGGAVGGAIIGAVGGGVQAFFNTANVGTANSVAQTIADAQIDYNRDTTSANNQYAENMQNNENGLKRDCLNNYTLPTELQQMANVVAASRLNAQQQQQTTIANAGSVKNAANTNAIENETLAKTIALQNKTTSDTNAANTNSTAKTNASNTQTMTKANADRTNTTSKANALNTQNTTKTNNYDAWVVACDNAERTQLTTKANALYTREVAELNAKELLENAGNANMAMLLDARNAKPIQIGSYSGDADTDYYMTRGVDIKVKTQSISAICQAGDVFARYGYTLNQIWDVHSTGLKLMNHFTYWKAAEIWIDGRNASNNSVEDFFKSIFLRGVTVWNSPTEIGRINVYDN